MKNIILNFAFIMLITGCASSKPVLKTTGYYSNGVKFLYCKNPNLFSPSLVNFINGKYSSSEDLKIIKITDTKSISNDDYKVKSPLTCSGIAHLSDGSDRDFLATISIPNDNSPRIESLHFSHNKTRESIAKNEFLKSFTLPAITYCQDLMVKVRNSYGKAPLCVPILKDSNNLTQTSGLVGLSDNQTPAGIYFYMTIIPGQVLGEYSYNENELHTLISLIKMQNKGV
jgi:hypothetical protein